MQELFEWSRPNVTDVAVKNIGKSIGKVVDILPEFDKVNGIPVCFRYHTSRSSKGDLMKLVSQLTEVSKRVFT